MWKLGMPRALARASMAGTKACQNSGLTWRAVSIRKPSMPYSSIQLPKISIIPSTTRGCSVNRSSSPTKSPMVELSPRKVVLPRL
jgi:hypothetical protein